MLPLTVRLGLLSTAEINESVLGARSDDAPFQVDGGVVARRGARRGLRVGARHPARARLVRGAAGGRRARRGLHRAPERAPLRVDDAGARGGQARARREAVHAEAGAGRSRRGTRRQRRGLVLVEGYMWRHSPQTQLAARRCCRELGELQAIHSWFFDPVVREHDVRFVPELGGGALLDLGCYCVGALRLVAGREPDACSGEARLGRGGVDERFAGRSGSESSRRRSRVGSTARRTRST